MANENRAAMEPAVTNLPGHRGAFVETMWGGVIYYTPDVTKPNPVWTEVFDDETAYGKFDSSLDSGVDGGSWLAVSPDDKYLFHAVMGTQIGASKSKPRGMLYTLDIQKLLASGEHPQCEITNLYEVRHGGSAPDCPSLAGVAPIMDTSSGGPHWGAMNNFAHIGRTGLYRETKDISQIAVSNYFVAGTGLDGNHLVCLYNIAKDGAPSLDTTFRDEMTGQPCVDFNRTDWPQGPTGAARPHGVLFVVPAANLAG
ncbi:MAG: hypothetical protein JO345_07930 [Streptosporangiaceae bacterium]|nr:hypothetical protein [Streptosporangiaceae bacterium]